MVGRGPIVGSIRVIIFIITWIIAIIGVAHIAAGGTMRWDMREPESCMGRTIATAMAAIDGMEGLVGDNALDSL